MNPMNIKIQPLANCGLILRKICRQKFPSLTENTTYIKRRLLAKLFYSAVPGFRWHSWFMILLYGFYQIFRVKRFVDDLRIITYPRVSPFSFLIRPCGPDLEPQRSWIHELWLVKALWTKGQDVISTYWSLQLLNFFSLQWQQKPLCQGSVSTATPASRVDYSRCTKSMKTRTIFLRNPKRVHTKQKENWETIYRPSGKLYPRTEVQSTART